MVSSGFSTIDCFDRASDDSFEALDYREEEKKKVVVTVFETISFGLGHKEERVCSRMSHQDMRLCDC